MSNEIKSTDILVAKLINKTDSGNVYIRDSKEDPSELIIKGNFNIENFHQTQETEIPLSEAEWTQLCDLELTPGNWLVVGDMNIDTDKTLSTISKMNIVNSLNKKMLNQDTLYFTGQNLTHQIIDFFKVDKTEKIYLNGWLSIDEIVNIAKLKAIKLG